MFNLLLFSKNEVAYLEHINEVEIIKAIKLFASHNDSWKCVIYEYSKFADEDDKYFEVLHFWY